MGRAPALGEQEGTQTALFTQSSCFVTLGAQIGGKHGQFARGAGKGPCVRTPGPSGWTASSRHGLPVPGACTEAAAPPPVMGSATSPFYRKEKGPGVAGVGSAWGWRQKMRAVALGGTDPRTGPQGEKRENGAPKTRKTSTERQSYQVVADGDVAAIRRQGTNASQRTQRL